MKLFWIIPLNELSKWVGINSYTFDESLSFKLVPSFSSVEINNLVITLFASFLNLIILGLITFSILLGIILLILSLISGNIWLNDLIKLNPRDLNSATSSNVVTL